METILIFYLPTKKRPAHYPPLETDIGKWWHTGIIYKDVIYECFSDKRYCITEFKHRKKQLDDMGAVYYNYFLKNPMNKITDNLYKGYSCDNFVEAVIGKPLNKYPTVINHFEK